MGQGLGNKVLGGFQKRAVNRSLLSCVTIHDVSVYAVPEAYSKPFIAWYKLQFQQLSRRLSNIITVSEFSHPLASTASGFGTSDRLGLSARWSY